jgi:hypothetical protein
MSDFLIKIKESLIGCQSYFLEVPAAASAMALLVVSCEAVEQRSLPLRRRSFFLNRGR